MEGAGLFLFDVKNFLDFLIRNILYTSVMSQKWVYVVSRYFAAEYQKNLCEITWRSIKSGMYFLLLKGVCVDGGITGD